eukprot:CAMPEP_0197537088 /NCGR_PEP_ID=MMETSP1318-20131121/55772_1 /TAXON_ID=552666 /ORGANISM="Partenskyella glossopodia, Strain RCC365" /LENGTH=153 /DNA_ID=CAMNT_0043095153 /DNA_START=55 /DNA_END=513 /DNA_ORIENTATION=+
MHHRRAPNEGGDTKKLDLSNGEGRLTKEILLEGKGPTIPKGMLAKMHIVGKLESGSVFSSSREESSPVEFVIGRGEAIQGWERGILTMQAGERSIFCISPEYAYGKEGKAPDIPGNATLTYDVELLGWTDPPLLDKFSATLMAFWVIVGGILW